MELYKEFDSTVYLHFAVNDSTGAGTDGSSPTAAVRLVGAAASAAPVYEPIPYLLSHASYPSGCYEVAIPATTANGFVDGSEYAVFCTLAVSSVNPTGFIGRFILQAMATDADIADAIQADPPSLALADGAITAAKIASGALTQAKFGSDILTGAYLNAQVKGQDNIDFGTLQKASLNASTPQNSAGTTILLTRITEAVATAAELAKVPKTDGTASFNATALAAVADALHDEVIESAYTMRQMERIFFSILAGRLVITDNGNGTHTYTFMNITNTVARLVMIVDDTTGDRTVSSVNGA